MELYRKVYIKSEADLPKENELFQYIVHLKNRDALDYCIHNNKSIPHGYHSSVWMEMYDWYLQPIEITDADIEAWAKEKIELTYEHPLAETNRMMKIGLVVGAKAVLNSEIKHIEK